MSILIKGMEMPEAGEHVLLLQVYHDGTSSVIGDHRHYKNEPFEAIPVPAHGRLIDADALEEEAQKRLLICNRYDNQFQKPYEVMRAIALAPTIIPAEEGET